MFTFHTLTGTVQVERFMQGPKLSPGMMWRQQDNGNWKEVVSTFGPESDPNHPNYDLHLFGEHHITFMQRQYK